ncbi:MAG: DinB family protein [Gemmatimonadota bacterium]|nr:DinB family protein [Gemmatimonadota bacterium]
MQHYGGTQMAAAWRTVRKNTVQIAEEIPADQYGFQATPDTMTVAAMLAHIATGPYWAEQVHFVERKHELSVPDFHRYFGAAGAMAAELTTKDTIVDALIAGGESFALHLDAITDEQLDELVALPNVSKSRFEMLLGVKEHEMHHRAQLMLVQRLLGLVPHLTRARQHR